MVDRLGQGVVPGGEDRGWFLVVQASKGLVSWWID